MSVLAIRILLAFVFAAAAAAKLAGRDGAVESLQAFGVPRRLTRPLATILPAVELAVAGLLLPARTAGAGTLAAAVLLALFTGAIALQLARGRRPDCNCFGRLQSKPIGPSTLVRNIALLGLAAYAALRAPSTSAVAWLSDPLLAAVGGLSALVVAQATVLVLLLRRHGHLLAQLDTLDDPVAKPVPGLPVGTEAPEFELPDLEGELVTLAALRERELPVLLVFSDPACGPCSALLPDIGRWQREDEDELAVVLVSNGALDVNRARASEHGLTLVLLQEAHAVGLAYGANGTPMAVLVDVDGLVATELAVGGDAIEALVASVVQRASEEVLLHV